MTRTPPDPHTGTLIAVLAYPGVDELDLFGGYAILAKAGSVAHAEGLTPLTAVIAAQAPEIRGSAGVTFRAQEDLTAVEHAQAVVVPGGRGATAAAGEPQLHQALHRAGQGNARLYSVCSGALVLAGAGLAQGRTLAIHAAKHTQLTGQSTVRAAGGLVRDGRYCSVGGDLRDSVKSVDLAFALLADLRPELVEPVSRRTEITAGRRPRHAAEARGA
ncbi:DJ-1/PfpI family protein [Streptomyces sp. NPDC012623]|uniref:DJ-1/PfpI family protein n=1 Tax=unclassified Streptomyces TaxID=2593676 RepID=UPI0036CAECF1